MVEQKRCPCPHHFIIPALIAGIGLAFLLSTLSVLPAWALGIIWPSFVALIGLQLLFSYRCKCQSDHSHCNHCHHCMHDGSHSQA